jgi:hypothetical protein
LLPPNGSAPAISRVPVMTINRELFMAELLLRGSVEATSKRAIGSVGTSARRL